MKITWRLIGCLQKKGETDIVFSINIHTACFAELGHALSLCNTESRCYQDWSDWVSFAEGSQALRAMPFPHFFPVPAPTFSHLLAALSHPAWPLPSMFSAKAIFLPETESEETTPSGCREEEGWSRAPATDRCHHPLLHFPERYARVLSSRTCTVCMLRSNSLA